MSSGVVSAGVKTGKGRLPSDMLPIDLEYDHF